MSVYENFRALRKGLILSARDALEEARRLDGHDVAVIYTEVESEGLYASLAGNSLGAISYSRDYPPSR